MDFQAAKNGAAREIALAFGVPPLLLGLPGDSTLANYAEANRAFWRLTVIPLVSRTMRAVAAWLGPAWGEALRFEPDLDRIEAQGSKVAHRAQQRRCAPTSAPRCGSVSAMPAS